ncbi:leucine-rich_repeat domain-containing protein [Hexamita inflata]|uniref:Leucine-rich repeat domain-containing protein n=1 Tax=Hexamita inflata TaxID=28002 RepID=A0AA86P878_9EUKA|nr:leucine-rich repeat domain-containing protein [Hexamita inflata]
MGAGCMTSQDKEIFNRLSPYDQKMIKKYKRQCKYKMLSICDDPEIVDFCFVDYLDLNGVFIDRCKNISFEKTPTKINYFQAKDCDIQNFDKVTQMQQLVYLDLSYNKITDISIIATMPGLTSLILSNNQISDISPLASLNNLKELKLDYNLIEDISVLKPLMNLGRVWLFNNKITNLEPLAQQMAVAAGKTHHHHSGDHHHHHSNLQYFKLQPQNV